MRAKSRAVWRAWLVRHHATAREVTLIYARKGSGKPSVTYDESVEEALCFGWIDGVRGAVDAQHYCVRFTPRQPASRWSKANLERLARLVQTGRMHPAGLVLRPWEVIPPRAPRRSMGKATRRRATVGNSRSGNAAHGDGSAAWWLTNPRSEH